MSSTRSASTPSEGEIVEDISDSEKATTSLPSANGTSVNRPSRPTRTPPPPSITEFTRLTAIDSSVRSPRRERSRSPYRESRGEKRRRDDNLNDRDHRRLNSKYDGRYYDNHRQQKSYEELDREAHGSSRLRYDEHEDRQHRDKRPRTRSRSPFRHHRSRGSQTDADRTGRSRSPYRHSRDSSQHITSSNGTHGTQQSVNERGRPSVLPQNRKQDAESRSTQGHKAVEKSSQQVHFDRPVGLSSHDNENSMVEAEPVDEAILIEERRKRREAIKAKYRGQATPLLVQALQLGNKTGSSTPSTSVDSPETKLTESAQSTPPQSPRDMDPASPVLSEGMSGLHPGEDLLKPDDSFHKPSFKSNNDEASAADYDPTMDMQDDRLKQVKFRRDEEMPSAAYDETQPEERQIPPIEQDSGVPMDGDDADRPDDDDFDMFGEQFHIPKTSGNPKVATGENLADTRKGKQLDAILLDDWDDADGYYRTILGEQLDGRYIVQAHLGKGMFSTVVRATDTVHNELVAIKIIRSNFTMKKAGMKEIDILQGLAAIDVDDKKHMIRLLRNFDHKGHLCMVFEHFALNLREVIKKYGRDIGVNMRATRNYAYQMFVAAALLRKGNLIHADLKPDNILVNEELTKLKVCDLGSAVSVGSTDEITPYLVSRFYRAPEIILGILPDPAIDMWSIGCTLFELYTGKILFTGRNNNQMLKSILECRGRMPTRVLKRAKFGQVYFDEMGSFYSVERDRLTGNDVQKLVNLTKPVPGKDLKARLGVDGEGAKRLTEAELKELNLFRDLLDKCLDLNPEKRCSPSDALKHPFILRSKA